MRVIQSPSRADYSQLFKRPSFNTKDLNSVIDSVFTKVANEGDVAVLDYTDRFDQVSLSQLTCNKEEIQEAITLVDESLKLAIQLAKKNIERFHQSQLLGKSNEVEVMPGVNCWREQRAIEKVGIYIPGGTAPLFSTVLMLAVPAKLSGCQQIVLCSPPNQDGKIHPAVLYTADLVGVDVMIKAGGSQAIAALALGTESVPKVDKIFGPGNQYVTAAKMKSQQLGVAIDMPAGPSEVLVIADYTANPVYVAADLLSQAEHGADSQVILLSNSESFVVKTIEELEKQLSVLPRKELAQAAIEHSKAIVLDTIEECVFASNQYAPEHLILAMDEPESILSSITNAGSVFVGHYSCESLGDYASGTNHTLPTNGYARNYSGVSVDSFMKQITFQKVSLEGLKAIGPSVEILAENEQLQAHKNAVTVRLNDLK